MILNNDGRECTTQPRGEIFPGEAFKRSAMRRLAAPATLSPKQRFAFNKPASQLLLKCTHKRWLRSDRICGDNTSLPQFKWFARTVGTTKRVNCGLSASIRVDFPFG